MNEQNQEWLKQQVESGKYASVDEVMEKARHLMEEREQGIAEELADIDAKLEIAAEQSRNGQYTEYDEAGLEELKERIKREGRERKAARNQHPD